MIDLMHHRPTIMHIHITGGIGLDVQERSSKSGTDACVRACGDVV